MEPLYENGTRNFFIDEITAVTDFQKYGNVLSDYFSAKGAKVIIAGTDSLGIMLAESDILYDRIQMIHTSILKETIIHMPVKADIWKHELLDHLIIGNREYISLREEYGKEIFS